MEAGSRRMMEGWIQLWYIVKTFANVTMHSQYNDNKNNTHTHMDKLHLAQNNASFFLRLLITFLTYTKLNNFILNRYIKNIKIGHIGGVLWNVTDTRMHCVVFKYNVIFSANIHYFFMEVFPHFWWIRLITKWQSTHWLPLSVPCDFQRGTLAFHIPQREGNLVRLAGKDVAKDGGTSKQRTQVIDISPDTEHQQIMCCFLVP
jgi:hypothetical protein